MIFDEHDLVKKLKKIDCFEAIGYAILAEGATAAAATTAGMAASSLAMTVVGTGFTAMQQAQQGQTANAFAQRNALIQNRNAGIAQQNAEFNAKLKEREDQRRRSGQAAGLQASGVEIYEGTNLIAMATQEFTDDMNAQLIRRGGAIESQNLQMQAGITSAQGTASQQAGYTAAGASLLTGAGQTGMQYAQFKRSGIK
jgi:Skp family chaperone for outer membrane proteins